MLKLGVFLDSVPGWALVVAFVLAVITGAVVTLCSSVVPQKSEDRVKWWKDVFSFLVDRKKGNAKKGPDQGDSPDPKELP